MIPLPALLAEIRAAGEPPATIGPRLSPEHIKHILRSGVYVGGGWAPAADCAIRQLRADLAQLAYEIWRRDAVLRAILEADERGQGLPFAEAIGRAYKLLEPPDGH